MTSAAMACFAKQTNNNPVEKPSEKTEPTLRQRYSKFLRNFGKMRKESGDNRSQN